MKTKILAKSILTIAFSFAGSHAFSSYDVKTNSLKREPSVVFNLERKKQDKKTPKRPIYFSKSCIKELFENMSSTFESSEALFAYLQRISIAQMNDGLIKEINPKKSQDYNESSVAVFNTGLRLDNQYVYGLLHPNSYSNTSAPWELNRFLVKGDFSQLGIDEFQLPLSSAFKANMVFGHQFRSDNIWFASNWNSGAWNKKQIGSKTNDVLYVDVNSFINGLADTIDNNFSHIHQTLSWSKGQNFISYLVLVNLPNLPMIGVYFKLDADNYWKPYLISTEKKRILTDIKVLNPSIKFSKQENENISEEAFRIQLVGDMEHNHKLMDLRLYRKKFLYNLESNSGLNGSALYEYLLSLKAIDGITDYSYDAAAISDEIVHNLGKLWVGDSFQIHRYDGWYTLTSNDGLRRFRSPTWKINQSLPQANFEWKERSYHKFYYNCHVSIMDQDHLINGSEQFRKFFKSQPIMPSPKYSNDYSISSQTYGNPISQQMMGNVMNIDDQNHVPVGDPDHSLAVDTEQTETDHQLSYEGFSRLIQIVGNRSKIILVEKKNQNHVRDYLESFGISVIFSADNRLLLHDKTPVRKISIDDENKEITIKSGTRSKSSNVRYRKL